MKKILLSVVAIVFSFLLHAQKADQKIADYLNNDDFFALKEVFPIIKDSVSPFLKDLTQSLLYCHFNRPKQACSSFQHFFTTHQGKIESGLATNLIYLWAENLRILGFHKEALQLIDGYLLNYAKEEQDKLKDYYRTISVYCEAYKNFPKSYIKQNTETVSSPLIFTQTGKRGQTMYIPVSINKKITNFIFDSGAGDNIVSEQFAEDNCIKVLNDSVQMIGAAIGYGKLGFADSLKIGDLVYYNASFLVVPEITPGSKFNDHAVLGLPFLRLQKEIQIYPQKKQIIFSLKESKEHESNLMLKNNQLIADALMNNKIVQMHFDTGSVKSSLNAYYYSKNKKLITQNFKRDTIYIGGYGAEYIMPVYRIPTSSFKIGTQEFSMNNIEVFTKVGMTDQSYFSGVFGVDFIQKFERISLNFNDMSLELYSGGEFLGFTNKTNFNLNTNSCYISNPYSIFNVPNNHSKEVNMSFKLGKKTLFRNVTYQFDPYKLKWEPIVQLQFINLDK